MFTLLSHLGHDSEEIFCCRTGPDIGVGLDVRSGVKSRPALSVGANPELEDLVDCYNGLTE
jgi:hypothetical protein